MTLTLTLFPEHTTRTAKVIIRGWSLGAGGVGDEEPDGGAGVCLQSVSQSLAGRRCRVL